MVELAQPRRTFRGPPDDGGGVVGWVQDARRCGWGARCWSGTFTGIRAVDGRSPATDGNISPASWIPPCSDGPSYIARSPYAAMARFVGTARHHRSLDGRRLPPPPPRLSTPEPSYPTTRRRCISGAGRAEQSTCLQAAARRDTNRASSHIAASTTTYWPTSAWSPYGSHRDG